MMATPQETWIHVPNYNITVDMMKIQNPPSGSINLTAKDYKKHGKAWRTWVDNTFIILEWLGSSYLVYAQTFIECGTGEPGCIMENWYPSTLKEAKKIITDMAQGKQLPRPSRLSKSRDIDPHKISTVNQRAIRVAKQETLDCLAKPQDALPVFNRHLSRVKLAAIATEVEWQRNRYEREIPDDPVSPEWEPTDLMWNSTSQWLEPVPLRKGERAAVLVGRGNGNSIYKTVMLYCNDEEGRFYGWHSLRQQEATNLWKVLRSGRIPSHGYYAPNDIDYGGWWYEGQEQDTPPTDDI